MKFPIDAQLPRRLVKRFREAGFEAIHTLDLPLGNRTPAADINELSIHERYVVVTKDAAFVSSFHLHHRPDKLLLVSTGNISNADLEALFVANLGKISEAFSNCDFIEMDRKAVIFHS